MTQIIILTLYAISILVISRNQFKEGMKYVSIVSAISMLGAIATFYFINEYPAILPYLVSVSVTVYGEIQTRKYRKDTSHK